MVRVHASSYYVEVMGYKNIYLFVFECSKRVSEYV